ncbi:SAV_2336 N-terminal domain-related protein [Streptomyces sp. NPDC127077]|uniref:SAV_2336 N-terminal domain-related protein n=1 Tax=Streptomyces sp. NPDC127077 TaxID=3347131 RepID=UPI00364C3C12
MAEYGAAQLLAALARVDLGDNSGSAEGDIQETLDALLLAAAKSSSGRTGDFPTDTPVADEEPAADAPLQPEPATDGSFDEPSPAEPGSGAGALGAASLWLKDDSGQSIPGIPVSMGRAPALPNTLDIGRALRPLRRFRPSRVHQRLDLDATVDHYTRTGALVPQLRPAAEPWLEVVVVVDHGTSMMVWDETSRALAKVLRALSAFRSIHEWHLEHPPAAPPVVRNHAGRPLPMDPSDPRHHQPAHRLLLVVSDCAAPAWRQNDLWQTLHTWGRTAPVALINPLPKRLWQRSGLDLPRTTATASFPASPGRLLTYRRPRLFRDDAPGTRPWQALPVLQLDAHQILAWARALMRTDPSGCEAVLVPASGRVPSRNRSPQPSNAAPDAPATDTQVAAAAEAFTDNLRSPAVRLAIAASSLGVFTLPILDVIRERIVPDASVADTAEFLTAGLLTATRHENPDIVYRLHPAAENHLRGFLSRDQAWDTHFAITDHLAAHPQAPHGIATALHSPTSQDMLPTGLQPLIQAAASTARLLGITSAEPHSDLAEQHHLTVESSDNVEDDSQQAPDQPPLPENPPEPVQDVAAAAGSTTTAGTFALRAWQRDVMDQLTAEREIHDRHRNLVVAPPGTGKMVMAAFDYKQLCLQHQRDLRLLFVADFEEVVHQAHQTYQDVLMTPQFGELLYGARTIEHGHHVFATWPALTRVMDELSPDHFDVIVIGELHGAGISAFVKISERFTPMELLGFTSVPELTNGPSIHEALFDGRIAAELRLWDAVANGTLCPIRYFGIADNTDLQSLPWKQGSYDRASLNAMLTGNDARAQLVISAIRDKISDLMAMRAVGFCVSVEHAEFMARFFRAAGIRASALTASTRSAERQEMLSALKSGDLQAIFNAGVLIQGSSIPEVNALLLLCPAPSTMRFLQQLGVGLTPAPGKPALTVLDFISHHRMEVSLDLPFRAMTNLTGRQLLDHVESDFPRLSNGCTIKLDARAKILVINNIRERMQSSLANAADNSSQAGEGQQPFAEDLTAPVAELSTDTDPVSGLPQTDRLRTFDQSLRLVRVRAAHGKDTSTQAGIMLTPRLVLTRADALDERDRLRIVRTDGTEIVCRTVWKRAGNLNAALVLADESILDSENEERLLASQLKWGRMPEGLMSPVRITGLGRSGIRTELSGQARPTAVRLAVEGTEPFTKEVLAGSLGAMVSCEGVFVGMVTRRHLQRPQLMAVPAELLLQDQGFRRTLATHVTTPYELEDLGTERAGGNGSSVVCLAVEARTFNGSGGTDTPHLESELVHDIRESLTAIMRRAGIDGVVAEEAATAAGANLLVMLNGPAPVQDMGRVLAELQTAVATHHEVMLGVGASIGEVTDTRLGLVGTAASEAIRLAGNPYFRDLLYQAARFIEAPVQLAVSNTLRVLVTERLDPIFEGQFAPLDPPAQPDHKTGWLYQGPPEQLGEALAIRPTRKGTSPTTSYSRGQVEGKNNAWHLPRARVVGVHGIGYGTLDAQSLPMRWLSALNDGLTRAGSTDRLSGPDMAMSFYGDLFRPAGQSLAVGDAPYTAADVGEGLERELLFAWWKAAADRDPSVVPPSADPLTPTRRSVQAALHALSMSRSFNEVALRAMVFALKQVSRYFTDSALRAHALARVADEIGDDTRVVVAHSLGSVVAYEALCARPDHQVRALVTLGSPLGIENLILPRLQPSPRDVGGQLRGIWPGSESLQWTNLADDGDVVALVKDLRPAFGNRVRCAVIHNGARAHDAVAYLADPLCGQAIAGGLA